MPRFSDTESKVFYNVCLSTGRHNITDLIQWLDINLTRDQEIMITSWYGDYWYVVVRYTDFRNFGPGPGAHQVGFTVNVGEDGIVWNDDYGNQKGNCFCRNRRWLKLTKEKCLNYATDEEFRELIHVYSPAKRIKK